MKKKLLGISVVGVVFLLLSVATLTPVTATPTALKTAPETDFDAIDEIFLKYEDDLAEIDAYIQDYIAEYSAIDENFTLPSDLQAKADTILTELKNIYEPLSGGGDWYYYTVVYFQWWIFRWPFYTYTEVGMCHSTLERWLNWYHSGGYTLLAILLCLLLGLGGIQAGVLALTIFLLGAFSADHIRQYDHGNGVIFWYMDFFASPPMDCGGIKSQ